MKTNLEIGKNEIKIYKILKETVSIVSVYLEIVL